MSDEDMDSVKVEADEDTGLGGFDEEDTISGEEEEECETPENPQDFEDSEVRQPNEEEMMELQRKLAMLSPECQQQLNSAYSGEAEMSSECQAQVQSVFAPQKHIQAQQFKPEELGPDPTPYIIAAVAFGLVAVGMKVYSISQQLNKIPEKPKKKLSKKKLMKQKMKEQRKQGSSAE